MRTIVLLGPQRCSPTVAQTMRSLEVEGRVATVTAGWQECEPDDAELDELLHGRSANLGLYRRWLDVAERDPEFAAADRRRRDVLDELRAVYLLGLRHGLETVSELQRRVGNPQVTQPALADAIDAVRDLDARHLKRVGQVHAEFHADWSPHDRPVVAEHRAAVARGVEQAGALAIAGGHVGVLLSCLQLFNVAAGLGSQPVVAWSAGAMAIADRVVLYHDLAPHGHGDAEVYDAGLSLCRRVVPLPHARRRLRIDDHRRMALLARRFAPARCLVLDDGVRVDCPDGECGPDLGMVVGHDGRVSVVAA